MGIRINKAIGYFLPKEKIECILSEGYEHKVEENEVLDRGWLESALEKHSGSFPNEKGYHLNSRFSFYSWFLDGLDTFNSYRVIQDIVNGYNYEGVLFATPDLANKSRYNDTIDYYEEIKDSTFKVKHLRSSIYPNFSYVCIKKPKLTGDDAGDFKNVDVGSALTSDKIGWLEINSVSKPEPKGWIYPENQEDKYFHPFVDPLIYIVAYELGVLKEGVSYTDFIQALEPAMITYWS